MFLVLVPFFLWVIAFMILPVLGMVQASFQHDNGQGFTLGQYIKSLTHPRYLGSFRNSIILSLFSAFVGLAVATFAAYSFTRFSDKVRDRLNPKLHICGILVTRYDPRTVNAREVMARVVERFGDLVFDTVITRTVRFPETSVAGEPITTWAPKSSGAEAYRALAREVIHRVGA